MVSNYIEKKRETTRRTLSGRVEDARVAAGGGQDDEWRSGSCDFGANPLVLHEEVFRVSLARTSVSGLRQWIVKAAAGRECPPDFSFPAVDQTLSKAWIDAYEAMDTLRKKRPFVMWSDAVQEFRIQTSGSVADSGDAGKVLLRAMQHREAEGGVLLSLADAPAPVAEDMIHLDPVWLVELVRRLADHNLVDENPKIQVTLEKELRHYAKNHNLPSGR